MDAAETPAPDVAALPPSLVFVDLETTGGNPAYHRITEVGIVRVEHGVVVEEWSSLVNPDCPIPPYIQDFTGISDAMVRDAPRFMDLSHTIMSKLRGAMFVAHNARFDYSFLRSEFLKLDVHFAAQVLCTVRLSRRLFPEHVRHNLDAVMERHGLTCNARHRALGDAQVLRDFWFKLRRELPDCTLSAATVHAVLGVPKLPAHLPRELPDVLPDGPGAYRYYDEDGAVLYVGRSNTLRARVLSQLGSEAETSRDYRLAAEVRRVDWVETAGELGASLREAQWIKLYKPRFNRRYKDNDPAVTLRVAADGSGRIRPTPVDELDLKDLTQSFGLFNTPKDARKALIDIARAHQLCLKVLGLEETPGSCLAFQIGKCKGACLGKEPLLLHNTRTQLALSALKLKTWPFPGRIGLREAGRFGAMSEAARAGEVHVLDQWAYLGSARDAGELASLNEAPQEAGFDVAVYRILSRYLATRGKLEWRDLGENNRGVSLTQAILDERDESA